MSFKCGVLHDAPKKIHELNLKYIYMTWIKITMTFNFHVVYVEEKKLKAFLVLNDKFISPRLLCGRKTQF
ncbi:hypothetical protein GCM10022397_00640 [Flavivirga jejuensis]